MIEKIKSITRGQAILLLFIIIAILSTFISLNVIRSNSIKSYKKFQNEMVVAAKNYTAIKNIQIKRNREKSISLYSLKKQNLLSSPAKDKCKGYVIVSNEETYPDEYEVVYRAYIKCGSLYKTDAYEE